MEVKVEARVLWLLCEVAEASCNKVRREVGANGELPEAIQWTENAIRKAREVLNAAAAGE